MAAKPPADLAVAATPPAGTRLGGPHLVALLLRAFGERLAQRLHPVAPAPAVGPAVSPAANDAAFSGAAPPNRDTAT